MVQNPFNGIERSLRASRRLLSSTLYLNPFNGIESVDVKFALTLAYSFAGIHSMELKEVLEREPGQGAQVE